MVFTTPKKFSLGGQKITVKIVSNISETEECDGLAIYNKQLIQLSEKIAGDYKDFVFFHELVHHILYHMSSKKRSDEKFVDQFATFLHQAIKTMK